LTEFLVRGKTSVGLNGYTSVHRNIIEPHGTPWNPTEAHGIPQNLMEPHGTSWNLMEGSGTQQNLLVADK
jgi:hypothetical protein